MKTIFSKWTPAEEAKALIPICEQRLMNTRLAIIEAQAKEREILTKLAYLKTLTEPGNVVDLVRSVSAA